MSLQPRDYFVNPCNVLHRQYEALRAFFYEGIPAKRVAKEFGYTVSTLYSLARDFKNTLKDKIYEEPFFKVNTQGRRPKDITGDIKNLIVALRKQHLSVPDIKALLDTQKYKISERYVFSVIKKEGFARLPRRDIKERDETRININEKLPAAKSEELQLDPEQFSTENSIGILCFLPYIKEYGLDVIIQKSLYPETKAINKFSSILSFLALKLSNIRRYSADDLWCMDRAMGLFAKLNVLPKTGWFSSYSNRVTRKMNIDFLKKIHEVWRQKGLLSDTMNLDFTSIPYWGNDNHLENNWSGKRHKALASMLAVLAQDPDSGIIDYGDVNVRHNNQSKVVLEFLDFYRGDNKDDQTLKYLVFDSKFTTHQNLRKLDDKNIKFITIRRRDGTIVKELEELPSTQWKKIHVMNANGKGRTLKVFEKKVTIKDYGKLIRQVAITGHGKIKPALIITNDFDINLETLIRKYSRRWIVEKEISEQIEFFHLNRVSSSMVIKVDFDFTMTILAHNLYRLFTLNLAGYSHQTDSSIFQKFLYNSGNVIITSENIEVNLKKKRNLPALLEELEKFQGQKIPWLDNRKLFFRGATTS